MPIPLSSTAAQNFGLSDAPDARTWAWSNKSFLLPAGTAFVLLTREAKRRLQAIENFSDLGSGIHIAMQDLDIRGRQYARKSEQSGFIADLGYETYQKIFRSCARTEDRRVCRPFMPKKSEKADGGVISGEQFVDECQVESDRTSVACRLRDWQRASACCSIASWTDSHTSTKDVDAFALPEDRFGPIPPETEELLRIVL